MPGALFVLQASRKQTELCTVTILTSISGASLSLYVVIVEAFLTHVPWYRSVAAGRIEEIDDICANDVSCLVWAVP